MLKGVDISNWQSGLNLFNLDVDFAIMKATEANYFVDSFCDNWVQQAKEKGIKWGFYHYALIGHNPEGEADFFVENTINYFHEGIPVLDIEENSIYDWGEFSDRFVERVHELTGVYPMIYNSAGNLYRFIGYDCPSKCGLWCAGYPWANPDWTTEEFPYSCNPWEFVAIWQFTSNLRIPGYASVLDGNIAYMDYEAWDKYAMCTENNTPVKPSKKSIKDVAYEVILGEWGTGADRRKMLKNAGYNYDEVQDYVNELYQVANDVIKGKYGNDEERIRRLTNAGYNYDVVQHIVNKIFH